nr:coat protein (coatomer) beta' [Cucujiformia]
NPKDNNTFATASLDRTLKVWNLGSGQANFTLEGHEKGVNCIDYCHSSDKPYLISGADDRLVKIWDYQTKTCVQTLEGHAQNVSAVSYHPELPIILTGSEDGTVRVWHLNTNRLENTLNYGLERVWTICCLKGSNTIALGYDEGSVVIKLGREEPAMSMDNSGKIVWARHSELQQANLKAISSESDSIKDGQVLPLNVKDMGSCEIYPQTIAHNSNGRFVVVCGDGEYIILTALTLRNKSFGSGHEFVWALDSSEYAVRENSVQVKIFKNFKEKTTFKPEFGAESIFGGFMLGVKSVAGLAFYEWDTLQLVRRIEIQPKNIFWSETGELVAIATEESYFILKYNPEKVNQIRESGSSRDEITEDGIEDAFDVMSEITESVKTGLWIGDCFIYTNSVNRLNYYVGGEIVTVAHLDKTMYLLGYISKENRLYLGDKDHNIVSYSLLLSVLEYQTVVMRGDIAAADKILPLLPPDQKTRVAHFLEKQGFKGPAYHVTEDPDHKFELALQLKSMKWKQLAEAAMTLGRVDLAKTCLKNANDLSGLLLLATSSGDAASIKELGATAVSKGINNVGFLSQFILGDKSSALDILINSGRLPEAAFFA